MTKDKMDFFRKFEMAYDIYLNRMIELHCETGGMTVEQWEERKAQEFFLTLGEYFQGETK